MTYTEHDAKVSQAVAYLTQHDGDGQSARHAADQNGDNIDSAQWYKAERLYSKSVIKHAAVALGRKGGKANAGIPKPASAANGSKGGRPKGSKNKPKPQSV